MNILDKINMRLNERIPRILLVILGGCLYFLVGTKTTIMVLCPLAAFRLYFAYRQMKRGENHQDQE